MNDKNQLPNENDLQLWERYLEAYETQTRRMQDIYEKTADFVTLMRYGLSRSNPGPALAVLEKLSLEKLKPYLNLLLERATYTNAWQNVSYKLMMRLPRTWLIENIENEADILLSKIDDDQIYWALLLLYEELDSDLAERLAHRALTHPNREIKEIGQEYFDKINGNRD